MTGVYCILDGHNLLGLRFLEGGDCIWFGAARANEGVNYGVREVTILGHAEVGG